MTAKIRPGGMALISAIFLVAVLLTMALAMVAVSNVQHDTGNKSLLSTKVYYGAKAGLDWGVQRVIAQSTCTPLAAMNLTQGGLNGVSVAVACTSTQHGAAACAGAPCVVYYLTSVATIGVLGNPDYAERHLEATVSNIP